VYQFELFKALRDNDYKKVITISKNKLKGNEFDFEPLYEISRSYYFLGDYDKAIEFGLKSVSCSNDFQLALQILLFLI